MKILKYLLLSVSVLFFLGGCSVDNLQSSFYNSQADSYYADKDYQNAYRKYEKAAKAGSGYAYYRLYEIYNYGKGVRKDKNMANAMLKKAVDLGDDTAMVVLANKLLSNKKYIKQAITLLKLAAQKENKYAYSDLYLIYRYGYGVKKDLYLANRYARLAKANGIKIKIQNNHKKKIYKKQKISKHALLRNIQSGLKKLGFYSDIVDGVNGPMTKKSIKMFQKFYGYKINPKISIILWEQIETKL